MLLRFCLALSLLFAAVPSLLAAPAVRVSGDRLTVTTEALEIALERGIPVRLANRLSGAVIAEVAPDATLPRQNCGLIGLEDKRWWVEDAKTVTTRPMGQGAEVLWSWADGATMTLRVDVERADVVLRLSGRASSPGLVGCRWSLPGVVLRGRQLYLPETYAGMLVDESTPPGTLDLNAAGGWSHAASLSFVQDSRGVLGMWPVERTGCATLFHGAVTTDGRANLSFESHGEPPFPARTEVSVAPWRLAAVRGHWYAIADRYRDEVLLPLRPRGLKQPEWIRDITCCVYYYPTATEDLESLARQVDPKRTLIVFPFYRKHGFDQGYPDWSASEGFPAVHKRALELGFRTCLWSNGGAVDPRMATYQELKQFHRRDPLTGKLTGWLWNDDPSKWVRTTCAQIHRGSSQYRRILVEGMKAVAEQLRPSAWHIDYSIGIADGLGRVEGLTDFEGFYKFLEELRAALPPDMALRGEGLALGNAANMDFAELYPWGAPPRGLPVCSYLYGRDVVGIAHVNAPLQRQGVAFGPGAVAHWLGWMENFGVIPSNSVGAPGHGDTPGGNILYDVAREFQRLRLRPDFSSPWSPNTIYRWRSAEGVIYTTERTATGARLSAGNDVVYERLSGTNRARVEGTLRSWPAQANGVAFGLNPGVNYLVERKAPSAALQILDLPEGAYVSTLAESDNGALLRVDATSSYRAVVDFMARANDLKTGVLYGGKRRALLDFGGKFEPDTGTCGGVARFGFLGNPPWKPGTPDWGQEFGELTVDLPATPEPLAFEANVGLQDYTRETDGLVFLLYADGKEIARQAVTDRRWYPLRADVSAYRGKRVTFRMACDPGPARNAAWDLALWADAAVRRVGAPERIRLRLPAKPLAILDASGSPLPAETGADGVTVVQSSVPGTIAILYREPQAAAYPVDLAARSRDAGFCDPTTYGTLVQAPYGVAQRLEGKPVLSVQPRGQGRGMLLYTLKVPDTGSPKLRFATRLVGSAKTGQFSVEVNGETAWVKLAAQATPEGEQTVDLDAYRGKTVMLALCYATHGGYPWGGGAYWVAPRIEDGASR